MNFSLLERIGVGALLTAWLIYGSNFLGNILVAIEDPPLPAAVQPAEAPPEPTAPLEEVDFASLLAIAEPTAGQRVFNRCRACHTIDEGGRHGVGPNLHNMVGRDIATKDGFSYSAALTGLPGQWDYDALDHFLENPNDFAPGTRMVFAGLNRAADRANVIAYLRENTQDPPPLPEPEEAVAVDEPEAAEDEAATPPEDDAATPGGTDAEQPAAGEPEGEDESTEAAPEDGAAAEGLEARIAAVAPEEGQKVFRKCQACHTVEEGAPHRVGPNLYNVMGRDKATAEGYTYSSALTGLPGEWTLQDMEDYLENPRAYAPGTKMTFAGLKSENERIAVIAFMRQHGGSSPPSQ
jgi:cytochrome c